MRTRPYLSEVRVRIAVGLSAREKSRADFRNHALLRTILRSPDSWITITLGCSLPTLVTKRVSLVST